MNLEYVKIVIAVVASIGINLVSPYHAKTIASETCHSSLKEFLTELNTSLSNGVVDADFFNFEYPAFNCVSTNLFQSVLRDYTPEVVQAVRALASDYSEDCVHLAEALLPCLASTLCRQRGGPYGFGDQAPDYPVFKQIPGNVDKAPVNNIDQERQCGTVDHLLKTRPSLEAAS